MAATPEAFVEAFPNGAAMFPAGDAVLIVEHTPYGIELRPAP